MAKSIDNLIKKSNRFSHIPHHSGVYMITDNKSLLSYIGSSVDMNNRVHGHTGSKTAYIKELDYNDCTVIVLEDCRYLTKQQRLQLEYDHIIIRNTIWPNGFNKASPLTNISFDTSYLKGKRKKRKSTKLVNKFGKEPVYFRNVIGAD